MKKPLLKFIALFLFTSFSWAGVSAVGWTEARFSDTEISETNICQLGTLDFSLDPPEIGEISLDASIDVSIVQEGTLDFQYKVKAELSRNKKFCGGLEVVAVMGGDTYYDGQLKDFKASAIISGSRDKWEFKITDSENSPAKKTCDFEFIFKGWQEDVDEYMDSGFSDKEIISGTVKSEGEIAPPPPEPGDVIINEVMWMGSKKDDETGKSSDEWIELYNTTDHEINIGQCEIENARSSGKPPLMIPANKIILPDSYFLIAHWPETSANSALNVEVDEVNASISLQNNYGTNGALILKNKEGTAIDSTPIPVNDNWPAGESSSTKKWSMEWDSDDSGWHTCDPLTPLTMNAADLALMKSYWDADAQEYNCGTPGAENL